MLTRIVTYANANGSARVIAFMIGLAGQFTSIVGHRGFWRICRFLGRFISGQEVSCTIRLSHDSQLRIDLEDPYWSRLVASRYTYEPEVQCVLEQVRDVDFCFVDGGANFGYWSILASSTHLGSHEVLAVEASTRTFRRLSENCALNNNRFRCLNYAITKDGGKSVQFAVTEDHAAGHIPGDRAAPEGTRYEHVPTISLDELVSIYCPDTRHFVVKLDLEGYEANALAGSTGLLSKEALVLYEEHGSDPNCRATEFILAELDFSVFFLDRYRGLVRIENASAVNRIKTRRTVGYNFLACRPSSLFFKQLHKITALRASV
jgi:FkbM family methyltransferase